MLDDFHRLSGAAARESVAWFVAHLPSTLQLVLATRTDPALPLGALRAHGQLLELRADELRFTARRRRVPQRPARARTCPRRRRVARRAHRGVAGRPLPGGALAGGQGRQARARDGLRRHERARRRLPLERGARRLQPELQGFMLQTSVLERLCAPLCDAVLGQQARRPARVARALEPVPGPARRSRRWFRFHQLFARLLRVEWRAAAGLVARASSARLRVAPPSSGTPTRRSLTRSRRARSRRPAS